jgi:uncharacterized membrane protein YfcA
VTNHTRAVLSSLGGFLLGCVGGFIVTVFGPLLFPASISGSSLGENIVVFSIVAIFLAFGLAGFLMCWRFTKRFAEKDQGSIRIFTD